MKRSRHVRLVLMTAAPLALAGCEGQEDAVLYKNVAECVAAGQIEAAQCESLYAKAEAENERVAPRYQSYEECVKDFGAEACTRQPTSSGYFIPFVQGMLIGNLLSGPRGSYYPQPVYRQRGGGWTTPGGDYVGNRTGQIKVPPSATKPQARAITMSRAGFGSRAAARGSWGG